MNSTPASHESAFSANRLILWALALGVVVFASVATFVGPVSTNFEPVLMGLDVIALVAVALTLQGVAASFFVPAKMLDAAKAGDPAKRTSAFFAGRIVAGALCEGPALLWCVALLLGGNRWYLVPIALLAVAIAYHAPTRDAFEGATGERLGAVG